MIDSNQQLDMGLHPWCITVHDVHSEQQLLLESLFAQANGYIGSRGSFEEPLDRRLVSCEGIYLNGLFHKEAIHYEESAYALPAYNHKMLQVPNGKYIKLSLDGEFLSACTPGAAGSRSLDLRTGILTRHQHWQTSSGKALSLQSRRFVSLDNPHLMCIEYTLTAENFSGDVEILSALDADYQSISNQHDPRVGHLSIRQGLHLRETRQTECTNVFLHEVNETDMFIASATLDVFPTDAAHVYMGKQSSDTLLGQHHKLRLQEGEAVTCYKWIGYNHGTASHEPWIIAHELQDLLAKEAEYGFLNHLDKHIAKWSTFWQVADVEIEGDALIQQGIRFNLYHVFQSCGRNGSSNIGAKGLTGPGYDGHYFWDTEIYVVPFLSLTQPELARKLIEFRINTLAKAKARAREMSHQTGALYPWRTIGGEECSAYFPAGTAQYHINAAVAYALKYYLQVTHDDTLLLEGGAEMLIETARLWMDLGHFNPAKNGAFCIDGVTGPDEYTAIVNNNFYTNAMAQMHLQFTLDMIDYLQKKYQSFYDALAVKIDFKDEEITNLKKAALSMYLPYHQALHIHMQDDTFLQKAIWDFKQTPKDKFPLLLHFHPLVIYRHQVLKQADVILAMYLLDDKFDRTQKARNLAYYEPITTHDSSLSSCIHSIGYSEIQDTKRAYQFFMETVRLDLDNHHNNSEHGVHIANMAGSWSSIVCGFAGLRIRQEGMCFKPSIPEKWQSYRFCVRYQGVLLSVRVTQGDVHYQLQSGDALNFFHFDEKIILSGEHPQYSIKHQANNMTNINQREPA